MQSLVERGFVRGDEIEGGAVRADGRKRGQGRQVRVSKTRNAITGQANCEVVLGDTMALGCVTVAAVAPFPDRPNEGLLKVNVIMAGGLCIQGGDEGEVFALGAESKNAARKRSSRVASILEHCLLDTRAVDLEGLCIVAGKKVWSIRVDVSVINDAGSAVDAGALAAFGALSHFRRPEVSVVGETVRIYSIEEREPVPLALHHTPLCVTFSLFHKTSENKHGDVGEEFFMLDPTDREELAHDGQATIIVNSHKEVCGIYKQGWPPLTTGKISHLVQLASNRSAELAKLIVGEQQRLV